jgi:hypothetical protein
VIERVLGRNESGGIANGRTTSSLKLSLKEQRDEKNSIQLVQQPATGTGEATWQIFIGTQRIRAIGDAISTDEMLRSAE